MATISFKPKQTVKKLLGVLPDRARSVIKKRFGLDGNERMTLEAIGEEYGITRERVRQIENAALNMVRKSEAFETEEAVFNELKGLIVSMGGVVSEQVLLEHISKDKNTQSHVHLLLVIGEEFQNYKEDSDFRARWTVDTDTANQVQNSLKELYKSLSNEDIIPEGELVKSFLNQLKDISEEYKNKEILKRWLGLSKGMGRNPLGEWGIASSPNINARGMRDYAFLIIRRHGSPMHFTEVAKAITDVFNKKAHVATCHNELIKDPRFVLVGRGLYALSEWGYEQGVVKEVIKKILNKEGPLSREGIIDRVLKERYVKENTIMVNLQDPKVFKKNNVGKYSVA
ncbi:MAG TPA: hypothetical protein ENI66_00770 [Candidatus Yonathbacteria bacterium]|nr:hypothetical protein [Candidatus Yonathbacteria bacterium]